MNKDEARSTVWAELKKVALSDSRFHDNFNEFIPDFVGSEQATDRLCALDIYREADVLFIAPDNCLEGLRAQAVRDRKIQLVTTFGIRRGVVELLPEDVPAGLEPYAIMLDCIEKVGRGISLQQLRDRYRIDLIITGGSVVSMSGVRFGKGHGYFDLEWAFLWKIGVVETSTPIVAFVHDCQVVDEELEPSPFDTVCDLIVTPTRVVSVENPQKPVHGVLWDKLESNMLSDIPPLQELKHMEDLGLL